jgi:hypothetical protein
MGFKWNGIHTLEAGIMASADRLPIIPEPRIHTEEIAGRDGFIDFSSFNVNNRAAYLPRDWTFTCSVESASRDDTSKRISEIVEFFSSYNGYPNIHEAHKRRSSSLNPAHAFNFFTAIHFLYFFVDSVLDTNYNEDVD